MKKLIVRLPAVGVVFAMIICFQTVVFPQEKPFTIDQISRAIAASSKDKKLLEKIVGDVRSRGVDFFLTQEVIARLRKAGATDEILGVINLLISTKDCRERIERFSKILQVDSKNAQAFFERGKGYKSCGMAQGLRYYELDADKVKKFIDQSKKFLDQAKNDFDEAIELEPKLSDKIAPHYLFIGEINESIPELTKAIELDPELYDGYVARADVFKNKKDYDKAIIDYNKAIEMRPNFATPHTNRGLCYFYKQDYDSALKDFNKVIEVAPSFPNNYRRRADLYDKVGKKDLAQQDRKKANEIERGIK
ncbi:MAG: tetratricopeptide repeat protein [Pyrinomonadaceae bacterium]|nr:tetratricopeptide repeat protein [Pyrinomonadaceae bacterium]